MAQRVRNRVLTGSSCLLVLLAFTTLDPTDSPEAATKEQAGPAERRTARICRLPTGGLWGRTSSSLIGAGIFVVMALTLAAFSMWRVRRCLL